MDLNKYLHELDWNNRLAVATSSDQFRNDQRLTESVYCFDDSNSVLKYPLRMFMRTGFPFHRQLNEFVQRVNENGLIVEWTKKNIREKPPEFIYTQVSLESFSVGILIIVGLLLLCFGVFILELIVYRRARIPGAARVWRYIEMAIDPNRYFLLYDLAY